MRTSFWGSLVVVLVACAGTVQAANDLDGKALLCFSSNVNYLDYGLVFDQGKVTRHDVKGYSKVITYNRPYSLEGTKRVGWVGGLLMRETLTVYSGSHDQCSLSTKIEIFQRLDEIIAAAKKKNKI